VTTCSISLYEALNGFRGNITHLDGRNISFSMPNATPETIKTIPGDGMTNAKHKTKGDLKIKFLIRFPNLSASDKEQISNILQRYK